MVKLKGGSKGIDYFDYNTFWMPKSSWFGWPITIITIMVFFVGVG